MDSLVFWFTCPPHPNLYPSSDQLTIVLSIRDLAVLKGVARIFVLCVAVVACCWNPSALPCSVEASLTVAVEVKRGT